MKTTAATSVDDDREHVAEPRERPEVIGEGEPHDREQHDAEARAEVAAVDRDHERPDLEERSARRVVVRDRATARTTRGWRAKISRRAADQPRHDGAELLGRAAEEQGGADERADDADRRERDDKGALAGELASGSPRSRRRSSAARRPTTRRWR